MSAHEPLSWLTLERYALGELDERARRDVEARLAESEADRAILAAIQADQSVLPELPEIAGATVHAIGARPKRKVSRAWGFASAGLAAAAALLVWRTRPEDPVYYGVKGSDFALQLVSDQGGVAPKAFHPGERFKVAITCPASHRGALRVLVFQGDERFEPLPAQAVQCGNLVPFPGAFSLDGSEPAEVCLYAGDDAAPARATAGLVCTRLLPN